MFSSISSPVFQLYIENSLFYIKLKCSKLKMSYIPMLRASFSFLFISNFCFSFFLNYFDWKFILLLFPKNHVLYLKILVFFNLSITTFILTNSSSLKLILFFFQFNTFAFFVVAINDPNFIWIQLWLHLLLTAMQCYHHQYFPRILYPKSMFICLSFYRFLVLLYCYVQLCQLEKELSIFSFQRL